MRSPRKTPARVQRVEDPRAGLLLWAASGRALVRALDAGSGPARLLALVEGHARMPSTAGRTFHPDVQLDDLRRLLREVDGDAGAWRRAGGPKQLRLAVRRQRTAIAYALRLVEESLDAEAAAWTAPAALDLTPLEVAMLCALPSAADAAAPPRATRARIERDAKQLTLSYETPESLEARLREARAELMRRGLAEKVVGGGGQKGRYRRTQHGDHVAAQRPGS